MTPGPPNRQPVEIPCGPCIVRSFRWEDAGSLVKHANTGEVWRNLRDRFPHPYTAQDAEAWLRHVHAAEPETDFAIDVGGEAVGGIGLVLLKDVERCGAELGYWLGEAFWGRGIATAAVVAVTRWAMETHSLTRVFAVPFEKNASSRRVLEKAGYALEGILRRSAIKEGRVIDQALYAFTRE